MDQPSTSGVFNESPFINSSSLNLSINNKINNHSENEEVDDDIEEVEVLESEKLQLQKVTSFVQAAYERVEEFSKQQPFLTPIPSTGVSEGSSCTGTIQPLASIPESIDGGRAEIEELKSLPVNFDSALRTNQALQRRLTSALNRLEKTLQENLSKQAQLIEEEEDQGMVATFEKDKEYRNKYFVRPSSFSIPYFKDRCGMPAPMNNDTKYKVENGYLDLYSTRLRTWLTSEQNLLVKEVLKEWKNQLIKDWNSSLRTAERKLKNNSLTEEEMTKINSEIQTCKNHINFFTNVSEEKIEIPRRAKLDWDKIAAQTFDGSRSAEECQLQWENLLHSDISKKPWSEDEDLEIQDTLLSCKEENPDWEKIALSLNTGRTPFQVMQRWVSFIRPAIHPAVWTAENSKKLEDTINMLRAGNHIPWALVSQHLTGYTKVQLQSRWRNINPDQFKGPFSTEEDFILIKGLYKFGMNFDVISYFLPGRNKVQVRERFKRAILPGLTSQPWTWREDKKVIHNCSFASPHWRMMAQLLPKRDTCQIRLRFYILHFWQSISEERKLPPPLFPLSMTTQPSEIKNLREKIVNFDPSCRIILDSIHANNEGLKRVDLSEKRRNDVCKKDKPIKLAKFLEEKPIGSGKPRLMKKRIRRSYGPRQQSWPDKALTEYFLPGRTSSSSIPPLKKIDDTMQENFHRIAQAFQLKVNEKVTLNEIKSFSRSLKLSKNDARLVNSYLVDHHQDDEYGVECLACDQQEPEIIPLMPANSFTMGAFRSLLLHKPKLEEMAAKEFLLYEVPRSQLHKLGEKPKTLNDVKISQKFEIPEGILENDEDITNEDIEKDTLEEETPKKRKAAAVADLVNYVYSKEVKKLKLLKEPTMCKEVLEVPPEEEITLMQLEGENGYFRHKALKKSKELVIEEEDNLLYHRLLSLFFWPALLALSPPEKEQLYLSKQLAEERELNSMQVPDVLSIPENNQKGKDKFGEMDLEETDHLIKKLEAVRQQKRVRYKDCYLKPEVPLTMADMKKRVYKKDILQLKRSLIMKKAWSKRKQGLPSSTKTKPSKVVPERTRPVSARLSARKRKTIKKEESFEEEEEMEQYDESHSEFALFE